MTSMTFAEGARWCRSLRSDCVGFWLFRPNPDSIEGMVYQHGPAPGWCAHTLRAGRVRTALSFVDAVAMVEQSALNAVDASSPPLKL